GGAVYDESGQLLTGSLLDYAIPRADTLPDIDVLNTVTRSPHHPLGVKGIGEAGTIASTATVYNAVIDALEPFGVDNLTMPLTPERVWRAMQRCEEIDQVSGTVRLFPGRVDQGRPASAAAASRREAAGGWTQPDPAPEAAAPFAGRA